MNITNKKEFSKILLGWILIIHFLYFFLYPFIMSIILAIIDSSELHNIANAGPISSLSFLVNLSIPKVFVYFHMLASLLKALVIPICSLVAGVLILRQSKKGWKFAIITLTGDLILRILVVTTLLNVFIRQAILGNLILYQKILFLGMILFDLIMVHFLKREKRE